MEVPRPVRADAVRNRARILDAAGRLIGTSGTDVGMDEIAAEAGVAVGTLYRHFPTKAALADAVLSAIMADVADDADRALDRVRAGRTAGGEVVAFLTRALRSSAEHVAIKRAAATFGDRPAGEVPEEDRAAAAVGEMLRLGKEDGSVRGDVAVDDVALLISTAPTDRDAAALDRWLALVLPTLLVPAAPTDR